MNNQNQLSTFFKSLYLTTNPSGLSYFDSLLSNTFPEDYINKQIQEGGEEEYVEFGLYLQNNKKSVLILNGITGEIIFEIPLTESNTQKTIAEILNETIKNREEMEIWLMVQ